MNINKYFINNLNEILILKIPNNILDILRFTIIL